MLKISNSQYTMCIQKIQNKYLTFQNGQIPTYALYLYIPAEYEPYL